MPKTQKPWKIDTKRSSKPSKQIYRTLNIMYPNFSAFNNRPNSNTNAQKAILTTE